MVVSSGAGLRAFPWAAVYGGTKASDRGFAEALRHELSGTGVSVTTVYPGRGRNRLSTTTSPSGCRTGVAATTRSTPMTSAAAILAAVEADERAVYAPKAVRLLGLNGLAPKLTDRLLARVRGRSAAPRPD